MGPNNVRKLEWLLLALCLTILLALALAMVPEASGQEPTVVVPTVGTPMSPPATPTHVPMGAALPDTRLPYISVWTGVLR